MGIQRGMLYSSRYTTGEQMDFNAFCGVLVQKVGLLKIYIETLSSIKVLLSHAKKINILSYDCYCFYIILKVCSYFVS